MRQSTSLLAAALPLLFSACGGSFVTSTGESGDAGPGGKAGTGAGGSSAGGRASTGGRSTGGRVGTGGVIGPGGFFPTGGYGPGGSPACLGVDCSFLDDQCTMGTCIGGTCQAVPIPDGQPCEDGSLCTSGDECSGGTCFGSASIGCPQPANACQTSSCDPSSGSCVTENLLDGEPCEDNDPCTDNSACKAGACLGVSVGCYPGDGCCPTGCTGTNDPDCNGCTNIATNAIASSSGGGQTSSNRGPEQMINGIGQASCSQFHWITNSSTPTMTCGIPPCEYIELSWPNPVTIASMYIDTEPAVPPSPCGLANRNVAGGDVQYFSNNQWHDIATLSGFIDDVRVDFGAPVTTTRLRVARVVTGSSDVYNSVIYEWYVYPQPGCSPP